MTTPPSPTPTSLSALLSTHSSHLQSLYNALSPLPSSQLVTPHLQSLHTTISTLIDSQVLAVQAEVDSTRVRVGEGWERVENWRGMLGEAASSNAVKGPFLSQLEEIERLLGNMRERMSSRGLQIISLQNRLVGMTREGVLGAEWLGVELESESDGWEGMDLRLERMSGLEREVCRCEAEIVTREIQVGTNVHEIFALRSELGIHQVAGVEVDPLDEAVLAHLGVGEGREKVIIPCTTENLDRLSAKRNWLEDEKKTRNDTIQATYDQLYPLWSMLGVSESETESFVNKWQGSTRDVVAAYTTELTRMLLLKRQNLSTFILTIRTQISALQDTLYMSPHERCTSFPPFLIDVEPTPGTDRVNENVSEELLVAHEMECERLEAERGERKEVLERLEKWFGVVEEMRELEASASDPSRLLGKATRGDPGRLLREEKARKRVIKEKPRLETELRSLIPAWEAMYGKTFSVNGVGFIAELDRQVEAEAAEKDAKKRSKLGTSAPPSRTTAPLKSSATGSSSTVPLKRQMTGSLSKPPLKRLQAQSTGSRPLSDTSNSSHSSHSSGTMVGKLVPQNTGMNLPANWGSNSVGSGSENSRVGGGGGVQIKTQNTGGFKPRASNLSVG